MRALTLYQPWATLVALGHKQWETRSWRTRYVGPLAIHAGKVFSEEARTFASEERAFGRLPARIPRACVVAIARLVRCLPAVDAQVILVENGRWGLEHRLGDFAPGRFAWELTEVVPLREPVWWKGERGLWEVRPDLEAALRTAGARW